MALTFYTHPMSRGRIARWMLEEVAQPYDTVLVDWTGKPAALLEANPLGKVPTIVHDGAVVSEAAAICAYLAEAFPQAGLAPTAAERPRYLRWMFFTAGPLEAAMVDKVLGVTVPPEREGMVGYATFAKAVDALEAAGVGVLSDCRRGECGLCAMEVLEAEGMLDHRDVFFSDHQHAEGHRICACVSRMVGGTITVDPAFRGDTRLNPGMPPAT